MSLPQPSDLDPLSAFFAEHEKPAERAEPAETAKDPPADDLRVRVERAERQIERTLIDITTLKSDLATLVGAVDDIRKRMSRPPARPPAVPLPPRKLPGRRAMAVIIFLLTAGIALWGLTLVASYEVPEPPRLERDTSSAERPIVASVPPIIGTAASR